MHLRGHFLASLVIITLVGCGGDQSFSDLRAKADSLEAALEREKLGSKALEESLSQSLLDYGKPRPNADERVMLSDLELKRLEQAGFTHPAQEIRESLAQQRQLLPVAPEGISQFAFYPKLAILLPNAYVFAYYEDGHCLSYMLLRYSISNGELSWKKVWDEKACA